MKSYYYAILNLSTGKLCRNQRGELFYSLLLSRIKETQVIINPNLDNTKIVKVEY